MTLEVVEFGWRNLLGIVAGGFANFFLGALWYMMLFNKRWLEATGRTPDDFKNASPGAGMLATLGGCFVTTAVLALVYRWAGGDSVVDGLVVGAILGAGVAAMEGMKAAVYNFDERAKPWALYSVNGSYAVCGLMLAGAVYALIA
jgi:hypothetical protein